MSPQVTESPVVSSPRDLKNGAAPNPEKSDLALKLIILAALFGTIAWSAFLGWGIGRIAGLW